MRSVDMVWKLAWFWSLYLPRSKIISDYIFIQVRNTQILEIFHHTLSGSCSTYCALLRFGLLVSQGFKFFVFFFGEHCELLQLNDQLEEATIIRTVRCGWLTDWNCMHSKILFSPWWLPGFHPTQFLFIFWCLPLSPGLEAFNLFSPYLPITLFINIFKYIFFSYVTFVVNRFQYCSFVLSKSKRRFRFRFFF